MKRPAYVLESLGIAVTLLIFVLTAAASFKDELSDQAKDAMKTETRVVNMEKSQDEVKAELIEVNKKLDLLLEKVTRLEK